MTTCELCCHVTTVALTLLCLTVMVTQRLSLPLPLRLLRRRRLSLSRRAKSIVVFPLHRSAPPKFQKASLW